MGFCSEADVEEFTKSVPEFERMLLHIADEEQHLHFHVRNIDPIKQWKLSPIDLGSRKRWGGPHHSQRGLSRAYPHPRGAAVGS